MFFFSSSELRKIIIWRENSWILKPRKLLTHDWELLTQKGAVYTGKGCHLVKE